MIHGPASSRLTIFEGPDGSGKSTAAKEYALDTTALYAHSGPFPSLTSPADLARMYVEAMMPAVLGLRNVVMDRCWLGEVPYGSIHRGVIRLRDTDLAMLDRLALRCSAAMVVCLPPWETCKKTWEARKGQELVTEVSKQELIYRWYEGLVKGSCRAHTAVPTASYDYTFSRLPWLTKRLAEVRTEAHPVPLKSCGNREAPIVLVGDEFGAIKPGDPLYQWCFASFSGSGCSQWLTQRLIDAGISEADLCWINSDQPRAHLEDLLNAHPRKGVIALGGNAEQALADWPGFLKADHPQYHKRFQVKEPYSLISTIKELLA